MKKMGILNSILICCLTLIVQSIAATKSPTTPYKRSFSSSKPVKDFQLEPIIFETENQISPQSKGHPIWFKVPKTSSTSSSFSLLKMKSSLYDTHPESITDLKTISELGRGASGTVCLVQDIKTGRYYAKKIFKSQDIHHMVPSSSSQQRQQSHQDCFREGRLFQSLYGNPFLIKGYGIWISELRIGTIRYPETCTILMEYAPKGDLRSMVK